MRLVFQRRIGRLLARWHCITPDVRRRFPLDLATVCRQLWSGTVVSRRLFALNLVLAGASVFCCIRIGHALFAPALPVPSIAARPLSVPPERHQDIGRTSHSSGYYEQIVTRTLFSPNRADSVRLETTGGGELTTPTLALYGVAISDDTRIAFVQDRATKQISSYKTGDRLAGGRLERIEPDRVVIMRAGGPIEVLLHRPKESQSLAPSPQAQSPEQVFPARRARGRQE